MVAAGRGRILLVDDDETITWSLARFLNRDHDVVPLTSPQEALRRIVGGERFDAIVCDMTMPELSGIELFDQVRAIDSSQSDGIIFMTGGAFGPAARAFLESLPNPCIQKPFSAHELRALVRGRLAALASSKG
jgi:CheY-like chemotaxis protein